MGGGEFTVVLRSAWACMWHSKLRCHRCEQAWWPAMYNASVGWFQHVRSLFFKHHMNDSMQCRVSLSSSISRYQATLLSWWQILAQLL